MSDYLQFSQAARRAVIKKRLDPTSCIGDWRTLKGVVAGLMPITYIAGIDDLERRGNQPFKSGSSVLRWVENADEIFPKIRWHDKVQSYCRHCGWYIDNFKNETVRGVVLTLPGRRGFAAGYADPFNFSDKMMTGPCAVEITEIFEDECDAACTADSLAENYADEAREEDAKFQAERQIENTRDEIKSLVAEILGLVHGIRRSTLDSVVCDRLRRDIRHLLAKKTQCYERIDKLTENYWDAVPN